MNITKARFRFGLLAALISALLAFVVIPQHCAATIRLVNDSSCPIRIDWKFHTIPCDTPYGCWGPPNGNMYTLVPAFGTAEISMDNPAVDGFWIVGTLITGGTNNTDYYYFPAGGDESDVLVGLGCAGVTGYRYEDYDFPPDDPCDKGMPVPAVSESQMNLWLLDEPMGYASGLGAPLSLRLNYKQREIWSGYNTNVFSMGRKWNFSWLSFIGGIRTNSSSGLPTGAQSTTTETHFPAGGFFTSTTVSYPSDPVRYYSQPYIIGVYPSLDNVNHVFTNSFVDGSKDIYGFVVTSGTTYIASYLSERWTGSGQRTRFDYYDYNAAFPIIRLKDVVDADGLTNTITYVGSHPYSSNLISQITNPFGRTVTMQYDTNGYLTNLTDVAGISTSFIYDERGYVTNMTTPYGSTQFQYTEEPRITNSFSTVPNGRSVRIIKPDGNCELYLLTNGAPGIAASYPTNEIPVTLPFSNTFETNGLDQRNTFHWDTRQYASLSSTNVSSLTTNDFLKARMKHFLKNASSISNSLSLTPSIEREPSLDGVSPGQKTWFDFPDKANRQQQGSQPFPSFVAQILPDGTTRFERMQYNTNRFVTNQISTWTLNGTNALRTNILTFAANNIDLVSVTNALGSRVLSNVFNAFHQVTTNFNALNEATVLTYDPTQRLTSVTFPTGLVSTNLYYNTGPDSNRASAQIDYEIVGGSPSYYRTNAYTYTNAALRTITDPRNLTVTLTSDGLQRLRRIDFPDGTFVTNAYDKLDLVRTVDRMGFSNSFGFNSVRQLVTATNAIGTVFRYGYCSCGSMTSQTNAFGTAIQQVTQNIFDLQGNLIQSIGPDGYGVTNNYNSIGQSTNRVDAWGSVTNWYNNQGLGVAVSNAFGRVSVVTYDVLDRITNSVNANAVSMTNLFDALNRVTKRGYPDGSGETLGYSPRGLTAYTNQLGYTNFLVYDAMGRKTAATNANWEITRFTYSPASDLMTLSDGKSQVTSWIYDEYGRTTNKVDAASNLIFAYQYDKDGRLTNRWTPAKGTATFAFDAVGNLTNAAYASSSPITLTYDALSRLTGMSDAVGNTYYTYSAAGQLQSEDGPWNNDTVTYAYNNRLRSGMTLQQPNASSWVQGYGYDSTLRLTNTVSPAGSFDYGYDPLRVLLTSRIGIPGGAYITNNFDSMSRLITTALKNSTNGVLNSHSYGYDLASERTWLTNTAGDYRGYGYDKIGQLKTAAAKEASGTSRLNEQFGYTFDAAGNLNYRTNNGLLQTFAVNNLNELSSGSRSGTLTVEGTTTGPATNVTVNGQTASLYNDGTFAKDGFTLADGINIFSAIAKDSYGRSDTNTVTANLPASSAFVYDLNGNLRTNGTRTFDYDDENQLTRVTEPNKWKSEFVYDGKMRRRVRKEFTWDTTGGTATELITSVTAGGVRNNFDGWVGFKFVTGDRPMSVTHLGRYVLSGNTASHTVKIVKPDGSDLSGASVSVPTSGATAGQYTHAALSSPVTLAPNTAYFIISGESSGGDTWYEFNTALTPGVGTVAGPVFANYYSTNYTDNSAYYPGWSYVPPGLKYSGSWLQTNEVHYIYDGNVVIQERDANNLPQVTYTRGKDLNGAGRRAGGIGGLLARTDNRLLTSGDAGANAYYHSDGSGDVTALINTNQNLVGRYLYDPFGNILSQSGPLADANLYRFSSKEWHLNSGLSYYLRRYYSPELQRWLNRDPLGQASDHNVFRFVDNDSEANVDPDGDSAHNVVSGANSPLPPATWPSPGPAPSPITLPPSIDFPPPARSQIPEMSEQAPWNPMQTRIRCDRDPHFDSFFALNPTWMWGTQFGDEYALAAAQQLYLTPALLAAPALLSFELLPIESVDITIGELLAEYPPDSMIHLSTASADQLMSGVYAEQSWVKLGEVSHMTIPVYQEAVVGPGAAASGPNITGFVVVRPGVAQFQPTVWSYSLDVIEYRNEAVIVPNWIVPVPVGK
jgi:RHS repeat-associated protein